MKNLCLLLTAMVVLGASGCSNASSARRDETRTSKSVTPKQQRSVEGTVVAVGEVWSGGKKEIILELEERLGTYYYAPRTCTARAGDRVVIKYTYRGEVRIATTVTIISCETIPCDDCKPRR